MPTHLKKLVRSRMEKTGESYATALRYVRLRGARRRTPTPEPLPVRRYRYKNARPHDPAIDAYVRSIEGARGEALARLVSMVRSAVPGHDEGVVHGAPWFCIQGEPFCYVVGYARHINLGFCEGVALPDPAGLLEGTGKAMRHVKLKPGADVNHAALLRLIREAARRVRSRQGADAGRVKEVGDARR